METINLIIENINIINIIAYLFVAVCYGVFNAHNNSSFPEVFDYIIEIVLSILFFTIFISAHILYKIFRIVRN